MAMVVAWAVERDWLWLGGAVARAVLPPRWPQLVSNPRMPMAAVLSGTLMKKPVAMVWDLGQVGSGLVGSRHQ